MSGMKFSLPVLYKLSSTGATLTWAIEVDGGSYRTTSGQIGGAMTSSEWTACEGKNLGRANETTASEQAVKDARSKWQKKKDSGYVEDLQDINNGEYVEPMLAKSYCDPHTGELTTQGKKLKFPVASQAKLDGCVSGDTLIMTKEHGLIPIQKIVEGQLTCSVLSFNVATKKREYKRVENFFIDRKVGEKTEWYEIKTESGRKIRLTGNHKVYLPDLKCWRRVDQLSSNQKLMVT